MVTIKSNFQDIESWLDLQKKRFTAVEVSKFERAIKIAESYYQGQVFYPTTVNLFTHALTTANIIAELHLHADAVTATLLYSIPKFCVNWQQELAQFDAKVLELVDGVNRVTQIRKLGDLDLAVEESEKKAQIEIIRKMLLAMASDIRIVLIMLVGRSELMLNLKTCKEDEIKRKIALETMEIFAPLANRLGVWQIKWELEDLSFKYLYPNEYREIASLLDETRQKRLDYIDSIKEYLAQQMEESGIAHYQISGRAKHIFSIWKKMKKKSYSFEDLYDIRAVRVLVPEVKDCYTVLGIMHTKYSPIVGEFDDYISNPKSNNYQSLHTCIIGPNNQAVEVQIRTFAMHDHAEYGVAAHWRYKEGGENNPAFEEKIAWIRQILDWRDELSQKQDLTEVFKNEIFSDIIYVMTPNGKVISLPRGSTAIDFAYAVHSNIGNRCRGAKVDGNIITLSTPLQNGQRVEILTVKDGEPSINWLHEGWVKSAKAISHIRRYIRNQNNEEFFATGHEILERELSKYPSSTRPKIEEITAKLHYENEKDIKIDLGKGDLLPIAIRDAIEKLLIKNNPQPKPELTLEELDKVLNAKLSKNSKAVNKGSNVLVDGISGIVTLVAKCCKPLPGDHIIGFITRGSGVAVHRKNCLEIKRLNRQYPNKIVNVTWLSDLKNSVFTADIEITANDRQGLLRDLTDLMAIEKLQIAGLRTVCKNNKANMTFTIKLGGTEFNFGWLIDKIYNIHGVIDVHRR